MRVGKDERLKSISKWRIYRWSWWKISVMWHIREAQWYVNDCKELRGWFYLHEWTVGDPWEGEGEAQRATTRDSRLASLVVALWEGDAEAQRATTRDTNLEWPWVTVRSILSFLTQPFPSFNSPYFPLNLSLLHLAMPFSICPTSFASLHLPGVALVVILLSVMRKGHRTHGNVSSLSYHALVGQWERCQDQKVCVYTCVCMGVGKGARVLMHLCNGCLAGLPDLAEPFPCLPGSSDPMQKPKDTLLPL